MSYRNDIAMQKAYENSKGNENKLKALFDKDQPDQSQMKTRDERKYEQLEKMLYQWLKKNTSLDDFTADHYALNASEHVRDLVHTSSDEG